MMFVNLDVIIRGLIHYIISKGNKGSGVHFCNKSIPLTLTNNFFRARRSLLYNCCNYDFKFVWQFILCIYQKMHRPTTVQYSLKKNAAYTIASFLSGSGSAAVKK